MTRIAVLDDYQDVALHMADWRVLPADVEVQVFRHHLADEQALVARLQDFEDSGLRFCKMLNSSQCIYFK